MSTLEALLDEVGFQGTTQPKDPHKLTSLQEEISRCVQSPNGHTLLCEAVEGVTRSGKVITCDVLANLSRTASLSPIIGAALALALIQGTRIAELRAEALKFLKIKLGEVGSAGIPSGALSDDKLQALAYFVLTSEELQGAPESATFIAVVRTACPSALLGSQSGGSGSGTAVEDLDREAERLIPSASASAPGGSGPSIAAVLSDYGSQCSATPDTFRAALKGIGIALDEAQVAGIIVAVLPSTNASLSPRPEDGDLFGILHGAAATGKQPAAGKQQQWNLDVVVEVLQQECRGFDWGLVTRNLDVPNLVIRSTPDFEILAKLFSRIAGCPIPISSLMSLWRNRPAQLAILVLAANTSRNFVNFADLITPEQRIVDVPAPANLSWMSPALYKILLELAGHGLAADVRRVLQAAAEMYPELVTLCLAEVSDAVSGVRAEILLQTLPMFTGLAGSRPTFGLVMRRLQSTNPDLLLVLFRIAFRECRSVQDIIDTEGRIKSLDEMILRRLDEDTSPAEVLGYWCVKADRLGFPLEERIAAALQTNPSSAQGILGFIKTHIEPLMQLRPGSPTTSLILSPKCLSILLRALQRFPGNVSGEEVKMVETMASRIPLMEASAGAARAPTTQPTLPGMGGAAPQLQPAAGQNGSEAFVDPNAPRDQRGASSGEVEDLANTYFQRIYASDITIPDVIQLLKRFKMSPELREQEIFRCMIHNLFDEYRFFHMYPDRELHVTGTLFGALVQHQLVSSITLGIALRYVLEALRKDPMQGGNVEKMFRFGKIALEQFRARLNEWPQYCAHLVQIPHFTRHCPELFQDAQRAISNPNASTSNPTGDSSKNPMAGASPATLSQQMGALNLGEELPPSLSAFPREGASTSAVVPAASATAQGATLTAAPAGAGADASHPRAKKPSPLDQMIAVNTEVLVTTMPPEAVVSQIHFVINNISKTNFDAKLQELRDLLKPEYYNWFANYMVAKRISAQHNLHPLYLTLLDTLDLPALNKLILDSAYNIVTKLLQSANITTSSHERSVLRYLGMWLGQVTLARNRPLLQRRINLKELLFWGYETGRLIAVCSFVAKIVEGSKDSKVFQPPNPWLMALLGVMRDLYELEDLKMNIKFEVQVLCKSLNIKIEDVPRAGLISQCRMPVKDSRNPDFSVKSAAPGPTPVAGSSPTVTQPTPPNMLPAPYAAPPLAIAADGKGKEEKSGDVHVEQTVIPNLAAYVVINPTLQFFAANPAHRRIVALAVDRAIREIIQPVVDRSVTIACVTTRQIAMKDFCIEPNEANVRSGAHLMVSHLASSLALVHCKEPLRASIGNHLRSLLATITADQNAIEQVTQVCANENLELSCALIEKAAMEKAIRDVDESISVVLQSRRKARETGQALVDPTQYPKDFPDALKPRAGGLQPQQLAVYEYFQRLRTIAAAAAAQALAQSQAAGVIEDDSGDMASATASTLHTHGVQPHIPGQPQLLSMAQALEAYQVILARIDAALKAVQLQAQGREITIAMLPADHEILTLLREMIAVTQRIQPAVRIETAMAFAESAFKRMVETTSVPDVLRLEVMVGCLEALRDACGGPKKFTPDIGAWLSAHATFNVNDDISRKIHRATLVLLLRAKLIRSNEVDIYFATYMDGGRNMLWVEMALSFVRQCLADGLAATYEFANTFDTVSKMRPANAAVRKQLQKWLTDLRTLATSKDEQKAAAAAAAAASAPPVGQAPQLPPAPARDVSIREHVTVLLERWLRVWTSTNDQVFGQYLQLMHQYGVLKTEEAADRFFRIATELCVDACLKSSAQQPQQADAASPLTFTVIDALSKLFLLLVRLADKEAGDVTVRVNLLSRILNAVARSLLEDHEAKKASKQIFDQRPFYRLLSNLTQDLGMPDPKVEPNAADLPLLTAYAQVYLALSPSAVPGFAFGWLQLISHRCFMPRLLLVKQQKGWPLMHRLLISLLLFLQPFLKNVQLNDAVRKLYKGALRVILVILHDFPEFLCEYHLSFCDVIPPTCVQLRNLVLSAFPRSMRPPDPFTPNLKVDLLPEIAQAPHSMVDFAVILRDMRPRLDAYLSTKQPLEFPKLIPPTLFSNGAYNIPLLNALVVYLGAYGVVQTQSKIALQTTGLWEIIKHLVAVLDAEGRYHLFNAMANQLRFPNSHTHFFSCVLLMLFAEADNEYLQEQITRVLLERFIVLRPHPWGLLVTFIELIKNPRYAFWHKGFTRMAPEIERVLESVARLCIPSHEGRK